METTKTLAAIGDCVEFYNADVLDADNDATGRTQGVVNKIDEYGTLTVFTADERLVRLTQGAVGSILERATTESATPAPSALDSLAKLATATRMTTAELAEALGGAKDGMSAELVQTWIDGTARPGVETAFELQKRLIHLRATLNQNRRLGPVRDAQLQGLIVALQNPTQRKIWIAKRAEMRRQFAR